MTLEQELEALGQLIEAIKNTMRQIDATCQKLDREIVKNIYDIEDAIKILSRLEEEKNDN